MRFTRPLVTLAFAAACKAHEAAPAPPAPAHDEEVQLTRVTRPSPSASATIEAPAPPKLPVVRSISFAEGRSAVVVLPSDLDEPARLLAMLHGVCVPPSYVCGGWQSTAAATGLLVCPTGNATCGPNGTGGPTWEEPFADIDADLERSIAAARRAVGPTVRREGAILGGFSRGAYAAVIIAVRHPGRWPFLVLNEADVELTAAMMHQAGVRAVALIAGEWSAQVASERKTAEALAAEGFPVRLWVMPKVAHAYSSDIDAIMNEAIAYLLEHEPAPDSAPSRALH